MCCSYNSNQWYAGSGRWLHGTCSTWAEVRECWSL